VARACWSADQALQVKRQPFQRICWCRANQHARHLLYDVAIATYINYQRANKELKSGSLAPHCRRGQRGGNKLIYEKL